MLGLAQQDPVVDRVIGLHDDARLCTLCGLAATDPRRWWLHSVQGTKERPSKAIAALVLLSWTRISANDSQLLAASSR